LAHLPVESSPNRWTEARTGRPGVTSSDPAAGAAPAARCPFACAESQLCAPADWIVAKVIDVHGLSPLDCAPMSRSAQKRGASSIVAGERKVRERP